MGFRFASRMRSRTMNNTMRFEPGKLFQRRKRFERDQFSFGSVMDKREKYKIRAICDLIVFAASP